jgi:predicted dehydrogenase
MKVGMVGCGRIAQYVHLPHLKAMEGIEVGAICDKSVHRLRSAQKRFNISVAVTDFGDLLNMNDVEAIFIATEDVAHAPLAARALEAGRHVFVEKPLSLTLQDTDQLISLASRNQLVLMCGYQKLYDQAVVYARQVLPEIRDVEFVHVQDICHDNNLVLRQVLPSYMLTPEFEMDTSDFLENDNWTAVGSRLFPTVSRADRSGYRLFLNLACHDMSVIVHLFGPPRRVLFADFWSNNEFCIAVIELPGGIRCVLEVGQTQRRWFDEKLIVHGRDISLHLEWRSPFIERGSGTIASLRRMNNDVEETIVSRRSEASPFAEELSAFVECVAKGRSPRSSAQHGRLVLDALLNIVKWHEENRRPQAPPALS